MNADLEKAYEKLFEATSAMRSLQRQFFRGNRSLVEQAKSKGKEVDTIIGEIVALRDPQSKLF